jgi:serine/threonine protein kinase
MTTSSAPPIFLNRYQLLARLGQGGMSDVFLAVTQGRGDFQKLLVIKVLRAALAEDPRYIQMFHDEARLSARLNHPNLVQTYEVGETDGHHYIAMEYLDGQSLSYIRERFHRIGRLPITFALKIVRDALEGLAYAHDLTDYDGRPLQVVHRDATPQNIFVTYQGVVKVVDFGIAQASVMTTPALAGRVNGKNGYMSPEQARGETLDARADIFTVGVVLWELLTGERLWPGLVDLNWVAGLKSGMIAPPSLKRPELPKALDALCMRALSPTVSERPVSARDFQRELEAILRTLGEIPTDRALGELICGTFVAERRHAQALIDRSLKSTANSDTTTKSQPRAAGHLPVALGLVREETSIHDALTAVDTPRAVALQGQNPGPVLSTSSAAAMTRGYSPELDPPKRPKDSPSWSVLAAIVLAGLAAGGVNALVRTVASPESAIARVTPQPSQAHHVEPTSAVRFGQGKPSIELSGDIAEDFTLSADNDYLLRYTTQVLPGATLTIPKGTTLRGDIATKAILVVLPGGRLEASGTAEEPIVFTSSAPRGQTKAGDWGGVIVLGRAPTNSKSPLIVEGLPGGVEYGGTDPNDSSGTLQFVRIEYSGHEIAPNNEINGLSLGGVGRGTTLDHVFIRNTADDCFEFFGGTVDGKYLACQNPGDDAFDWDYGYTGRLQFLVAQSSPSTRVGSNGFEGDNDPRGSRARPQSHPEIWNATLCGKNRKFSGEHNAMLLRRATAVTVRNSIFSGFASGLDMRDVGTAPDIQTSVFWGNTMSNFARTEVKSNLDPELRDDDGFFDETALLRTSALQNSDVPPGLADCFHPTQPAFYPSGEAPPGEKPPRDGFFDPSANYRGAVASADQNWLTEPWAAFGP